MNNQFKRALALVLGLIMVFSVIPAGAIGPFDFSALESEEAETPQQTAAAALPAQAATVSAVSSARSAAASDPVAEPLSLTSGDYQDGDAYGFYDSETIIAGNYLIATEFHSSGATALMHSNASGSTLFLDICGSKNPTDRGTYATSYANCGGTNNHLWAIELNEDDSDGTFFIKSVSRGGYITADKHTNDKLKLDADKDKAVKFSYERQPNHEQGGKSYSGHYITATIDGEKRYLYSDTSSNGVWSLGGSDSDGNRKVIQFYKEIKNEVVGSKSLTLTVYDTYQQQLFNPTNEWIANIKAELSKLSSDVATVTYSTEGGKHYLNYTARKAGELSFTVDGVTFSVTVNGIAGSTVEVTLKAGGEAFVKEFTDKTAQYAIDLNTDSSIATATITNVENGVTIHSGKGYQGTGSNAWSDTETLLAHAAWTFDKQEDGTYIISATKDDSTVYIRMGDAGIPTKTTSEKVAVAASTKGTEAFTFHGVDSGKWLYFWRGRSDHHFDQNSGEDGSDGTGFYLYRPKKANESTSSSEVPGFVKLTSVDQIEDGGQYLIVTPSTVASESGTYFALYPTVSTSKYEYVMKIDPSAAQDVFFSYGTYTHTLTITPTSTTGETYIKVGDTIYHVTVADATLKDCEISITGGTDSLNKVYDGTAADTSGLTTTCTNASATVTYRFYDNADRKGALESAPVNVGNYWVTAYAAQDSQYLAAESEPVAFSITQQSSDITGVAQKSGTTLKYTDTVATGAAALEFTNPKKLAGTMTLDESWLIPGHAYHTWVFTPTDTNYAISTGQVRLTVSEPESVDYRPAGGTTQGQPFASGTGGSKNFRIPSLLTLKHQKDSSKNGRVLAAIDARWNILNDGCGLDTIVSYSDDGGENWTFHFPNYFEDSAAYHNLASAIIDPVMAEGNDGTIYMMVDVYPGGIAINTAPIQPEAASGYLEVNGKQRMVLYTVTNDGISGGKSNQNDTNWAYYIGDFDSTGYAPVYAKGDSTTAKYYVNEWYYLYDENKAMMYCKRLGSEEWVQQNVFFYNADLHVRNATYLGVFTSTDGGESWSAPHFINDEVKTDNQIFYGVGPGAGLTIQGGELDGMVLLPAYTHSSERSSFVYTRDGGKTWARSENATNINGDNHSKSSESFLIQIDDTTVRQFYRDYDSTLYYTDHTWNGTEWKAGKPVNSGIPATYNNQLSGIQYSKKIDGKTAYIISTATGLSGKRQHGVLYTVLLNEDKTMTLAYTMEVNGSNVDYAYSSLAERKDGSIALLYETTNNKVQYSTYDINDVMPGALIEGQSQSLTVEQYLTVERSYGFTVTQAEQDAVKTNAYVSVTVEPLTSGGVKLSILGKKVGTTSVTLGGYTFNVTVEAVKSSHLTNVTLLAGGSETVKVASNQVIMAQDSSIATVTLGQMNTFSVTGCQGAKGTTTAYDGDLVPLSDALYQITGNATDGYTVAHINDDGSKTYLAPGKTGNAYPNTSTFQSTLTFTPAANSSFTIQDNTNQTYLYFWDNYYKFYAHSGGSSCMLFRVAKEGESTQEIPGYVRATTIENGELYLISVYSNGTYYVVNPDATSTTNVYSQLLRVDKTAEKVTDSVFTGTYDLTITGVANGETYLTVGERVFHITVSDRIAISSETTGGAGQVRTITTLGTYTGAEYLVVQITEGTGASARVSVMMLPLKGENPVSTISYKTSAKVDVFLADGMPNLTGSGDAGATILASASAN